MLNTAGKVRINSYAIYSSKPLYMDEKILGGQMEPIYKSCVLIQDVTWKTCRERWTIWNKIMIILPWLFFIIWSFFKAYYFLLYAASSKFIIFNNSVFRLNFYSSLSTAYEQRESEDWNSYKHKISIGNGPTKNVTLSEAEKLKVN